MKWFDSTFRIWEDSSHSYAARLADALNEQRLVGSFCDVIIKVGDKTFPAHRGVLCAASRYFQGLLDGNFKEHGATEVDLSDSIEDSETLSAMLDYIYTGKLKVEKDSYEKLLAVVSFLLLEDARHLMASFLLENLVLENCTGIMLLADRYSLHELSAVTFEIVSSRLHDYFIHDSDLKQAPLAVLSRLAGIQAFNSVSEEDLLTFLKSYLHNYASCNSEERQLLGSFEEVIELFRDRNNDFDHEVTRQINETFIRDCKTVEDLNLRELEPLVLLENSDTAEEQEVLCIVSAKFVDNDRVVLTIHTYFAHSSKWAHFAEFNISKRDHRTFKNFIGVHHTGELLFSTEKRVAFVNRNGDVRYVNSCCFVCSRGVDLECKHYYFCFQRNLFSVVASVRGNIVMSESENSSEWEKNKLAYILSVYDDSERDWIDIDEFCSDILLGNYMADTGLEVTQYPEFHFGIHPQKEATWILATLKANDSNIVEGKTVEEDGGKIMVKVFKLVQDQEHDIFKLLDVQSSSVLENSGARKCLVRSICDKDKLFVQSLVLADDPSFEPEILYYSGPMYTYDLIGNVWKPYPWINTPTKNQELNPLRGKEDHIEPNRDSNDKNSNSTDFEAANPKVFNVTFTSSTGSSGKEYKESGSIAPSQPLPLVEFKQRRKFEHEQLIRGTHSGRHIDTYQRKVYGTLLWRTEMLPSNRYGSFYQVHILSTLVTELWQYNMKDMNWQYLPPPPVDTSIMHVSVCSLAMADLPDEQINGGTIKSAKFIYSDKNYDEFRPFTNYHLKTAHEKLFHIK